MSSVDASDFCSGVCSVSGVAVLPHRCSRLKVSNASGAPSVGSPPRKLRLRGSSFVVSGSGSGSLVKRDRPLRCVVVLDQGFLLSKMKQGFQQLGFCYDFEQQGQCC